MTRFQATGPRIRYVPPKADPGRETPVKQLIGLYNTWQSLPPSFRDKFADVFSDDADVETGYDSNIDTSAVRLNAGDTAAEAFGSPDLADVVSGAMAGSTEGIDKVGDKARLSWEFYTPTIRERNAPLILGWR